MPIKVITVPPHVQLAPPGVEDLSAEERVKYKLEVLGITKFVVKYLLEQPRFRSSYASIKAALTIERSLNALASIDLGGVWELSGEEHALLVEAIEHPEHLAVQVGPNGTTAVPTVGFALLPWATRQLMPFMEAIVSARDK